MIAIVSKLPSTKFQSWFLSLSKREQRLLNIASILLGLMLFYFLLWQPSLDFRNQYVNELEFEQTGLDWMRANETVARARVQSNSADSEAQLTTISRTAGIFNVPLNRVQPIAEGVSVNVSNQKFNDVISWIFALQNDHGISVIHMRMSRTGSGTVDADIVFR